MPSGRFNMNDTLTDFFVGFLTRKVKATAGVADALESSGFKAEKAKRSSLTSPNRLSRIVSLETGYDPEYPNDATPVK